MYPNYMSYKVFMQRSARDFSLIVISIDCILRMESTKILVVDFLRKRSIKMMCFNRS